MVDAPRGAGYEEGNSDDQGDRTSEGNGVIRHIESKHGVRETK